MSGQKLLSRIHRALGWIMLILLPAQVFLGLGAGGRMGGGDWAGAVHVSPVTVVVLGLIIITHGLLGIRFSVLKRWGLRKGAVFLTAVWLVLAGAMIYLTLR